MTVSFQTILDKLNFKQVEFLSEIYDLNYEGHPLMYYILDSFDKDFSTFEDNSENDTFGFQEILLDITREDSSNIVRLIDLMVSLNTIKVNLISEVEEPIKVDIPTPIEPATIVIDNSEVMDFLKKTYNEITELKQENEYNNQTYITLPEIAKLTRMSEQALRGKLFDPSLLYPFRKKKSGTTIILKKTEVIKWFDANF